jgi:hypothetical protein
MIWKLALTSVGSHIVEIIGLHHEACVCVVIWGWSHRDKLLRFAISSPRPLARMSSIPIRSIDVLEVLFRLRTQIRYSSQPASQPRSSSTFSRIYCSLATVSTLQCTFCANLYPDRQEALRRIVMVTDYY